MAWIEMNVSRDGYAVEQINRTITIGELIETLQELAEEVGEDTPVYTSHDNGYTFGGIGDRDFRIKDYLYDVFTADGTWKFTGSNGDCMKYIEENPDEELEMEESECY